MPGDEQQHERQRQRRADGERHRQRAEDERQRPRERRRRRCGSRAPAPRAQPGAAARRVANDELDERHRSSSSGTRAGAEPVGGLAVHPAALAAEEQPAQAAARAQQPPRALGVGVAAVLGEEAEVAADVLAEHAAAVRGAADVHALGAGKKTTFQPASRKR